jgi:tetratricopeptide (TPR) repeat protein
VTRERRGAHAPPKGSSTARRPGSRHTPVREGQPLHVVALAWVAALTLVLVSFRLDDYDFWQHLLVGRVVWGTHHVPVRQLWTWPTFGAPDVNSSWGFETLLYPLWLVAGVPGLFVWRWLTALATLAISYATTRTLGARGLAALLVLMVGMLAARDRFLPRPESLATVLLAVALWILERRRSGHGDRAVWLVPLAWVWANCHVSYFLGLLLLLAYALEALARSRRDGARLLLVLAAAVAISFVNPFGWRALLQPFDFALHGAHEPIYRGVGELRPPQLLGRWTNGLLLLVVAWPAAWIVRAARGRRDLLEGLLLVAFTALALNSNRFVSFYAVLAMPFLARDVSDLAPGRRAWLSPAVATGMFCAVMLLAAWPEASRPQRPPGIALAHARAPRVAVDSLLSWRVGARMWNPYHYGGYVLWRGYPTRLPFMDIHQAGGPGIRAAYFDALYDSTAWRRLEQRLGFDAALIDPHLVPVEREALFLDRDSTWALVFLDDAAAVYLKRRSPNAALIARYAAPDVAVHPEAGVALYDRWTQDSLAARRTRRELERMAAMSPENASLHAMMARVAIARADLDGAEREFAAALAVDPLVSRVHFNLGQVALLRHQPGRALAEFTAESRLNPGAHWVTAWLGESHRQLGDRARARALFLKALRDDPHDHVAQAGLAALGS